MNNYKTMPVYEVPNQQNKENVDRAMKNSHVGNTGTIDAKYAAAEREFKQGNKEAGERYIKEGRAEAERAHKEIGKAASEYDKKYEECYNKYKETGQIEDLKESQKYEKMRDDIMSRHEKIDKSQEAHEKNMEAKRSQTENVSKSR